ncbi:type III helper protein HopAK1 [Erwinia papayae]|uniref:Type III helper protein HopAK1 n=1 Tax=Erwinia papayae TaxID=206499 RepID=A0ABV3N6T1_9GAMM
MMIQNRVTGLSTPTFSESAGSQAQDPLKQSLAGCHGAGGGSFSSVSNSPISYGKTTSPDALQSGAAGTNSGQPTLQSALTQIAQLLRELLPLLLSRMSQNNQSSGTGGGQQGSGSSLGGSGQQGSGQNTSGTNNPIDFSKFASPSNNLPATNSGTSSSDSIKGTSLAAAPVSVNSPVKETSLAASPVTTSSTSSDTSSIKGTSLAASPVTTSSSGSTPAKETSTDNTTVSAPTSKSVAATLAADATHSVSSTSKVSATSATSEVSSSKSTGLAGMTGFAKAANTTGGAGGKVVTVSTVDELQKSLEGDEPTTIKLSKDLSSADKVVLKFGANKTLEGTSEGTGLHNIYLASDKTAGNDVFQNLNFTHDDRYRANGDIPLFISNGSGYWIDHNTFSGTKDKDATGLDKLLYVGGTADNVTLSNSVFKDNEYGVILGQPDDSASAKQTYGGYPRMTIANNVFDNLDVRAPGLMRQGKFDVYNNTINNFHLGYTIASNATVLSQSNYFNGGYDVNAKSSNSGVLDDKGDAAGFKDIGSNVSFKQSSATTDWVPDYSRTIKTPEEANAYNLANAGAGKGSFAS